MTTVHVGLPAHQGSLERYASHFDLLEIRPIDTPLPKSPGLRKWRRAVPPTFVFSVVVPNVLSALPSSAGEAGDKALKTTLATAEALEARCIVLTTPPSVTPTSLNRRRLEALLAQLPRDVVTIGWEPRGIWSPEEAEKWARELGVHLIVDASQQVPPKGAVLYTRLRGIGAHVRIGAGPVGRVREALVDRREAFVVIESEGPKRIAEALRAPLEGGGNRPPVAAVLRPQMRAEDEEQ